MTTYRLLKDLVGTPRHRRFGVNTDTLLYLRHNDNTDMPYFTSDPEMEGVPVGEGNDNWFVMHRESLVEQDEAPESAPEPTLPQYPLPHDSAARKEYPLFSGLMQYFPSALAAVAHHSFKGNEKHNPGKPLQHARDKSGDHLDAAGRHLMEQDLEGLAWRALAALQEKLEKDGAPIAPAATFGEF